MNVGSRGITVAASAVAVIVVCFLYFGATGRTGTVVLTLQSSGASAARVGAGTPLFLEILVNGTTNAPGPSIGGWLRPWHRLLKVRATRGEQQVALPLVEVDAPRVRELIRADDGRPTLREGTPSTAALDGMRRVFRLALAASPETTRQLTPGTYRLVALLQTPWWRFWGWRGRVESLPVIVDVMPTEPVERRLAGTARFMLETERFDEAIQTAREWMARDPKSVRAPMLLGDALAATGQREAAREAYERALVIANALPGYERPRPILDRLDRLLRLRRN